MLFYCQYHWQHKVVEGTQSSGCSADSQQKCSVKIKKWKARPLAVNSLNQSDEKENEDIRLAFTTKATCHCAQGQSKSSYSPVKGAGVNVLRLTPPSEFENGTLKFCFV